MQDFRPIIYSSHLTKANLDLLIGDLALEQPGAQSIGRPDAGNLTRLQATRARRGLVHIRGGTPHFSS